MLQRCNVGIHALPSGRLHQLFNAKNQEVTGKAACHHSCCNLVLDPPNALLAVAFGKTSLVLALLLLRAHRCRAVKVWVEDWQRLNTQFREGLKRVVKCFIVFARVGLGREDDFG